MIPVNQPLLDGNEKAYLAECIDTGWISSEGPFVKRLEDEFAARVGRRHGIAVCNGSAALDIAAVAFGLMPGDQVIMPSFTIISCAAAVIRCGAVPIFVDSDPVTWNMDVESIEALITPQTKAIMAVHIYGLPVDMDPLLDIAARHGLGVIEDAAELHGAHYMERPCGSFGNVSTFSFYPNKHITTGEGGMLVTDNDAIADRCRSLRNLCFQPGRRFVHDELGWNFRMSNLQAAVGVAQLERLDEFVERKYRLGRLYDERLSNISSIQLPAQTTSYARNIYWVYGVVIDDDCNLDAQAAMAEMAARGIGTRPFFWPMHLQPVLRRLDVAGHASLPVAERLGKRGFYLPSGLALTEAQIDKVSDAMHQVFR